MRTNIAVSTALAGLAALVLAADGDKAIIQGDGAKDLPADSWQAVAEAPTNSTTSKFTGFDVSKAFPSSEQEGWELSIDVKENAKGSNGNVTATVMSINPPSDNTTIDDSWQFCVYAFNVKATSAYAYHSGQTNSCNNLVNSECVDDLKRNGASAAAEGCKGYSTTASCLRDLDEQSAMALSLSGKLLPVSPLLLLYWLPVKLWNHSTNNRFPALLHEQPRMLQTLSAKMQLSSVAWMVE